LYNDTAGSKYLEYNPGSELNLFSFEQQTMNNEKAKESNENKSRTKVEQKLNKYEIN
jgi:hypothetical protein